MQSSQRKNLAKREEEVFTSTSPRIASHRNTVLGSSGAMFHVLVTLG